MCVSDRKKFTAVHETRALGTRLLSEVTEQVASAFVPLLGQGRAAWEGLDGKGARWGAYSWFRLGFSC